MKKFNGKPWLSVVLTSGVILLNYVNLRIALYFGPRHPFFKYFEKSGVILGGTLVVSLIVLFVLSIIQLFQRQIKWGLINLIYVLSFIGFIVFRIID